MGLFRSSPSYSNPADAGMPYLNAIPGTVTPYYNPEIQLGKGAARASVPVYNQMLTNPSGYYNNIMSGYTTSPEYQYNQQQLMGQQQAAAASGGFSGTQYDQANQAATTQGLLSQDEQQYFNNIFGINKTGLQGANQYVSMGYDASNTLAQLLGANLAAQAGLAYKGTAFTDQLNAEQRGMQNKAWGQGIGFGFGILDPNDPYTKQNQQANTR